MLCYMKSKLLIYSESTIYIFACPGDDVWASFSKASWFNACIACNSKYLISWHKLISVCIGFKALRQLLIQSWSNFWNYAVYFSGIICCYEEPAFQIIKSFGDSNSKYWWKWSLNWNINALMLLKNGSIMVIKRNCDTQSAYILLTRGLSEVHSTT